MNPSRPVLTPDAAAALTRLVLSYCLGRGSISLYSRSYVLQVHHLRGHTDYAHYQWRRIRHFLPVVKPPVLHDLTSPTQRGGEQWRLRISSRWFETAWRLLYGQDGFRITSAVLELLGAEAIASLWADRARLVLNRSHTRCTARLNLSRYDWESAQLVQEWIAALTGARGRFSSSARSIEAPMLLYNDEDCGTILAAVRQTWMAQARCLSDKFNRPRPLVDPAEEEALFQALQSRTLQGGTLQGTAPESAPVAKPGRSSLLQPRNPGAPTPPLLPEQVQP